MNVDIQQIKHRFGIIGTSPLLDHAIRTAVQVAPTDMSVLVIGESGVGKESFPKIIHQNSIRKHGPYIAVNCGAIPEGTIDSELFGHLKGSFTGAITDRKGYFQEASGGTIFLDEVGELPLSTQARLLRVLETGEFIPVGASQAQKTDVRIVAATNVNLQEAVERGRFREDLLFRLNTAKLLEGYRWPGNIRELRNFTDRISVLEEERTVTAETVSRYLPRDLGVDYHPALRQQAVLGEDATSFANEREILYQVLFDMKKDMAEMKNLIAGIMRGEVPVAQPKAHGDYPPAEVHTSNAHPTTLAGRDDYRNVLSSPSGYAPVEDVVEIPATPHATGHHAEVSDFEEQPLSLEEAERSLIQAALIRHDGRRRRAAQDLKISERTLYRKIKEYGLEE